MSTTAQLVGRVRYKAGQWSVQAVADADIVAHLNRGQEFLMWGLHVSAMPEHTETATGSLTNSRVGVPSDFAFEQLVEVGATLVTCRPWPVSALDALGNIPQFAPSTSQPYYYIWYNATDEAERLQIELGNASSTAAYSLRYVQLPADLAMTDSDPIWDERSNDLLVDFAVSRLTDSQGRRGDAQRMMHRIIQRIIRINGRFMAGTRHERTPSFG